MPNPDSMDLPPSANERDEPHVSSEPDGRLLIAVAIVSVLSPLLLPAIVESTYNFDGILRLLGELVFLHCHGFVFCWTIDLLHLPCIVEVFAERPLGLDGGIVARLALDLHVWNRGNLRGI